MEQNKDEKNDGKWIAILIIILPLILAGIIIYELSIGAAYFLSRGGWEWLLVVAVCILLALLFGPRNSSPH